jgi:arginyl-tRNA synthetase
MNVHTLVLDRIVGALKALEGEGVLPVGLDPGGIEVAPPRAASRGDLSSNAALVLGRAAGMKPHGIAARLAEKLRAPPDTEAAEVAGAGFLNLRFAPRFWHGVVAAILRQGSAYGRADLGGGERVNVAYVSFVPTGRLHVAHGRAAVLADAIANLLAFVGYEVTREHIAAGRGCRHDGGRDCALPGKGRPRHQGVPARQPLAGGRARVPATPRRRAQKHLHEAARGGR